MLWFIALSLAAIAATAWYKPAWFKNIYETTLAWVAVGLAGVFPILSDLFDYFSTDTSWAEIFGEAYRPIALVIISVLGILIRHLNVGKKG